MCSTKLTTPSISNYKTLSINSCPLRKVIRLAKHIKYANYLYYYSKIIIFLFLYSLVSHNYLENKKVSI